MFWTERCLIPFAMPAAKLDAACCVAEAIHVIEDAPNRYTKQVVGCQKIDKRGPSNV